MIQYVTCMDCLRKGEPQAKTDAYANDNPVATVQCPHCDKYLNT